MTPALLVLAAAVAAPGVKDPPKKDEPTLVGEWVIESAVDNGKPDNPPAGTTWTFTADRKSVLKLMGMVGLDTTYEADPKKSPPTLDVAAGPAGQRLRGIYKVEKDTLTLCLVDGDRDRPTELASPAGSKVVLLVLKRVAKKE